MMDEKFFKCSMCSMYTKKFTNIIRSGLFGEFSKSFDVNKNKIAIKRSGESDGGAGGEFFLCTYDKRFFIKTITIEEEKVLKRLIDDYSCHLREVP